MLIHHLCRIPAFAQLPACEIQTLATKVSVLCVPRGRALLRARHEVPGYFFLLKGVVQTIDPTTKLRARRKGHLVLFYPGCRAVKTLTPCQVLRIDAALYDFLVQSQDAPGKLRSSSADAWLERFLGSHMMRQVSRQDWQRLLTSFEVKKYAPGVRVLSRGDAAKECYVVESGHAVVHDDNQTLSHLAPGDFFGEDALVLGGHRTAHVSALEALQVQVISEAVFAEMLLDSLVQFVFQRGVGTLLVLTNEVAMDQSMEITAANNTRCYHLLISNVRQVAPSLDVKATYYIAGGSRRERGLCALLLVQRGLRAYPLEQATVPTF